MPTKTQHPAELRNRSAAGGSGGAVDPLLAFFQGKGTDNEGRTLKDYRKQDFVQMERVHNYVQWMFPTDEQSMFALDAPILTPKHQWAFKQDVFMRRELHLNFISFCKFLGLEVQELEKGAVKVTMAKNFRERVPDCWTAMFGGNHNWLRISRVLHCLGLCSIPEDQKALMACLEEIYAKKLSRCETAMPHWRQRAKAVPSTATSAEEVDHKNV
jgi:hypothetical protein